MKQTSKNFQLDHSGAGVFRRVGDFSSRPVNGERFFNPNGQATGTMRPTSTSIAKIDSTLGRLIHVFRSQGFAAMKSMAEGLGLRFRRRPAARDRGHAK